MAWGVSGGLDTHGLCLTQCFPNLAVPGICRVSIITADAGPLGSFHIPGDAVERTGHPSSMLTVLTVSYCPSLSPGWGTRFIFSLPF